MIKTFVSYHHLLDQHYKDSFVQWAEEWGLISNRSVEVGDIDETLPTQTIRRVIRDDFLMDTEVTVLLCGKETRYRKHIDWELKSSMINGSRNTQSGILVINLPNSGSTSWHSCFGSEEKSLIYPDYSGSWISIETKSDYKTRYPNMPERILENLIAPDVKIPIVPWENVYGYPDRLKFLLSQCAQAGKINRYDLSRPMRMKNYNPREDAFDFRV
ncbi:MTH538 TIR-like domain [Yoonia rosea]|uniref:MTH538 TIR-like domain n=1 Tax=Yoonia rosea TaxID=287098 RepID=A0A1R3XJM8_9RHOB|nr:TIR domain-containing protein [Yoonia rosea]SIT91852.1 MTH538 TIR-like domain [Yoonia rosea]